MSSICEEVVPEVEEVEVAVVDGGENPEVVTKKKKKKKKKKKS